MNTHKSESGKSTAERINGYSFALLATVAVLSSLLLCSCSRHKKPPVHVVVITMDTTRADHMGFLDGLAKTPSLNALAGDSVIFDNCFSAANSTLPSHASIFTSLYVKDHSVVENSYRLPDLDLFMPKVFKARGITTAAFTSAGIFSEASNFNQGFDQYSYPKNKERQAETVTNLALSWLDKNSGSDFFLWVHYYDPHMYYFPPPEFRAMYNKTSKDTFDNPSPTKFSKLYHKSNKKLLAAWKSSGYLSVSDDPQFYRNLYAGEVSYMDMEMGRLFDRLKKLGIYDNCIIVVVADHGESLGEKGIYFDHTFIYDKNIHVPLLIKPSSGGETGHRTQMVSSVDIYPTVLELAKIPVPDGIRGKSLVGAMKRSPDFSGRDHVYYEHIFEKFIGIKSSKYTYITYAYDLNSGKLRDDKYGMEELYSVDDVHQSRDLSSKKPDVLAEFRPLADKYYADKPLALKPVKITDALHTRNLKALGYIQ